VVGEVSLLAKLSRCMTQSKMSTWHRLIGDLVPRGPRKRNVRSSKLKTQHFEFRFF